MLLHRIRDLVGVLSSYLGALSLIHLDMSGNTLAGSLPALFSTSLQFLNLRNNMFWGTLPTSLWAITSLTSLSLSVHAFNGGFFHLYDDHMSVNYEMCGVFNSQAHCHLLYRWLG